MTMANINTTEVLFENISEEETASVTGGQGNIAISQALADALNNTGNFTNTITSAVVSDVGGLHRATSVSQSVAANFNDKPGDSNVSGPGVIKIDAYLNSFLKP